MYIFLLLPVYWDGENCELEFIATEKRNSISIVVALFKNDRFNKEFYIHFYIYDTSKIGFHLSTKGIINCIRNPLTYLEDNKTNLQKKKKG